MSVHFLSKRNDWGTPARLFNELDREFHFTRDVCANRHNFKVTSYWDEGDDALKQNWTGILWMNPPYGRAIGTWVKKAFESRATATVVCLLPSRTDSQWWHQYVLMAEEIRFIKGRLKFQGAKDGAPFPSAIVIFRRADAVERSGRNEWREGRVMIRPISIRQAGNEWVVEMRWKTDASGEEAVCGMFVSPDESAALSYLKNAERILDCWYVDQVWEGRASGGRGE